MLKTGIYKITNLINKKIYIGSASQKNGIGGRISEHKSDLKNNKHDNSYLQNSWNKYGEDNFKFEIVIFCDPERCLFFEQKCLDKYKPWDRENGYNICKIAGSSLGYKHTEQAKEKISSYLRLNNPMKKEENKDKFRGNKNPNFGGKSIKNIYKHTSEHKNKITGKGNPMFGKKSKKSIKIERIDINTGEVKEYNSVRDVKKDNFNRHRILFYCKNKEQHKGYWWNLI